MVMHKIIEPNQTIGIIGLAKNTGKTTTLNHIISQYQHLAIGITSIGLDGEAYDQIFDVPKPLIIAQKGHIIATAKSCLIDIEGLYDILENTKINTPLGDVMIIKMRTKSHIVIAGPSTKKQLETVIVCMQKYTSTILIDGAFNRMAFASVSLLDGIILTTGASYHPNMEQTLLETKRVIRQFGFPITKYQWTSKDPVVIQTSHQLITSSQKQVESIQAIIKDIVKDIQWIFIRGAITNRLSDVLLHLGLSHVTCIIEDPTKLMVSETYHRYFETMNITFEVLNRIPLLAITINPYAPQGHRYDMDTFRKRLMEMTDLPIIDIKEEDRHATTSCESAID